MKKLLKNPLLRARAKRFLVGALAVLLIIVLVVIFCVAWWLTRHIEPRWLVHLGLLAVWVAFIYFAKKL